MMRSEMVQLVRVQRSSTVNHFWKEKRRKKESSEERWAMTRMEKVWGEAGSAAVPLPLEHHQQQECPGSPHSSCLISAPCSP